MTLFITIDETRAVSAILDAPASPRAVLALAHGAGAGMRHPFLAAVAAGLAARGVAVLRYQFPYMEAGSRRPDRPPLAHATVRSAALEAARLVPGVPQFAGGKSFGGRMSSQAEAASPIPGLAGLIFLGFPLHPPEKPGIERAAHLAEVGVPMLFLQGTRDAFADLSLLRPIVDGLGTQATLTLVEDADHSFNVPAKTGRKNADVREAVLDATVAWIETRR